MGCIVGVLSRLQRFDWTSVGMLGKALFIDRLSHDLDTLNRQVENLREGVLMGQRVSTAVVQELTERTESITQIFQGVPEFESELNRECNDVMQVR